MYLMIGQLEIILKWIIISAVLFSIPVLSALLFLNLAILRKKEIFSFASGVILSAVFLRIIPESLHNSDNFSHTLMFLGVVISIILDKLSFLKSHHLTYRENELSCWSCEDPFRVTVVTGLGLHYISDGFFMGGFLLFSKNFFVSLLPILAHKVTDGLILSFIYSDHNKKRSIAFIFLTSAFNILGATLVLFSSDVGHIFAPVSAGILTYVAIHDFIPLLSSIKDFALFGAGAILIFTIVEFLGH